MQRLRCGITNHRECWAFQPWAGECLSLALPTLADFLQDIVACHERECEGRCGIRVGQRFWEARLHGEARLNTFIDTSNLREYILSTPLKEFEALIDDSPPGTFHLVVEGLPEEPRPLEPPPAVTMAPSFFPLDDALVFVMPGSKPRLLTSQEVCYVPAYSLAGAVIVDKSQFVSPRYTQPESMHLPLIRRPAGYGKTFFLSLLEAYLDMDQAPVTYPRAEDPEMPLPDDLWPLDCGGSLLVLHMDLAELHLSSDMDEDEAQRACTQFLTSAATACYQRYSARLLDHGKTLDECFQVDFWQIIRIGLNRGFSFFLGIDNYTTPIIEGPREVLEPRIIAGIFDPILSAVKDGCIRRGFMVGNDVGCIPRRPYYSSPLFASRTLDLTYSSSLYDAFGLSEQEIDALATATLGPGAELLREVRARSHGLGIDTPAHDFERVYSTRDVIAVARAMGPSPSGPMPTRVHSVLTHDFFDGPVGAPVWFHQQLARVMHWPHATEDSSMARTSPVLPRISALKASAKIPLPDADSVSESGSYSDPENLADFVSERNFRPRSSFSSGSTRYSPPRDP